MFNSAGIRIVIQSGGGGSPFQKSASRVFQGFVSGSVEFSQHRHNRAHALSHTHTHTYLSSDFTVVSHRHALRCNVAARHMTVFGAFLFRTAAGEELDGPLCAAG